MKRAWLWLVVGAGMWWTGAVSAQPAPDSVLTEICRDSFYRYWERIPAQQWSLLGFHLGMTLDAAFHNFDSTTPFYLRPDPFKVRRYYFTDTGEGDRNIPLLYLIWQRGSDSLDEIVVYPIFWKYCHIGLSDSAYHHHIVDLMAALPGPAAIRRGVEIPHIHLWESAVIFPKPHIYITRLRQDSTVSYRVGLWRKGDVPPTLNTAE